ncbi:MAG: citryl-CoA lyase [Micropruina sp.]|nr:citryl-CoA lyase [Micropruina sp.]
MTAPDRDPLVDAAHAWWTTEIIDIHPGEIGVRGYPIEQLIGRISFPQMIWLMLRGDLPSADQAGLLEAALVASVDHGPHAPSIAISRMSVTCGLPLNGAMASAINVLDDVHGGAGQQCMELYREIDELLTERDHGPDAPLAEADAVAAAATVWTRWNERGIRYAPGFGHRFHPLDPRAPRLLGMVDDLAATGAVSGRFATIGRAVEEAISAGRSRRVPMNIDGATAAIYSELGFAPELGRGIFILSRSVGILAHAWEQTIQGGRIKGPMPPQIPYRYAGSPRRDLPGATHSDPETA